MSIVRDARQPIFDIALHSPRCYNRLIALIFRQKRTVTCACQEEGWERLQLNYTM